MERRTKDAKKIVVEAEVCGSYWTLIGMKPGLSISVKEVKKRALEFDPKHANDFLYSVEQFESAVLKLLEKGTIREGHLLDLSGLEGYIPAYFPRVLEKISDFGFPVKIIDTKPKGPVKVHPSTDVEIKLKLKP
jgi:hypothetical protein